MPTWTLAVEAVPAGLSAMAIEGERCVPIELDDLADGDTDVLTRTFAGLVRARGAYPERLLLIVPGDVARERYDALAEAVSLAGLPDPSWLPDAVARAGTSLAGWAPGVRALIVDARGPELVAWSVRTADDGVEVRAGGAIDVSARLDDLLSGVVQAKLSLAAPAFATAIRDRGNAQSRRDAAHLTRELRRARQMLSDADGEELLVSTGAAEISIEREEFGRLVRHAVADTLADAVGVEGASSTAVLVVADDDAPVVDHLVAGGHADLLDRGPDRSALAGAAALARPRTDAPPIDDADDADDADGADEAPTDAVVPPVMPGPRTTPTEERRPRWVVPALSTALVLSMSGAAAVLTVGPPSLPGTDVAMSVTDTGRLSPVVPIGFDRLGGN